MLFYKIYFKEIFEIVNFYFNLNTTYSASSFLGCNMSFWGHLVEMTRFHSKVFNPAASLGSLSIIFKGPFFSFILDYVHLTQLG